MRGGRDELIAAIGEDMAQPPRNPTLGDQFVIPAAVWIAQTMR